jgi:hypothetical protein
VKATARPIVELQAATLDLKEATTMSTVTRVRPLVGGNSHYQGAGAARDNPLKICARKSMRDAMRDP